MLRMIIKITGFAMVVIGAGGLGRRQAAVYDKRLGTLEQLRTMLFLLKGQILYANATLEEAFCTVGERTSGVPAEFFLAVAQRIHNQKGEPFFEIWKEEAENRKKDLGLLKKGQYELEKFGEHLGYLNRDMQERTILLYLEQLDLAIGDMREHRREKMRLYTSLGVMGGFFLAILLC